jgi:hypothetical protein
MLALTREKKALWPLAKVAVLALKHMVWDARSWRLRLGLGAIIVPFIAIGNAAAASVDLGGGVRLPLWLPIGAAGTVIGLLRDLYQRHRRKRRMG